MAVAEVRAPAAAPSFIAGMSRRAKVKWTRYLLLAGLIVAFEIYARFIGSPRLFSPPTAIVYALFDEILVEAKVRGAIYQAFIEVMVAYAMSIVFGIAIGLAVGWSNFGRRSTYPIVILLYAIPQVILLPLFVLIFGIGPACKIAFGVSHGVFPIIVNVVAGMRNVNVLYLRSAEAMGASAFDLARHVYLPNMVPSLFAGLRLGMTMTLLGVILAELYVSIGGVGYWTKLYAETFDPAPLFALITVLALMAILLNELVRVAERRFTRWRLGL